MSIVVHLEDSATGAIVSYKEVTLYYDGSVMTREKCDGITYRYGMDGKYYKKVFDDLPQDYVVGLKTALDGKLGVDGIEIIHPEYNLSALNPTSVTKAETGKSVADYISANERTIASYSFSDFTFSRIWYNGSFRENYSWFKTSDFIPVKKGDSITVTTFMSSDLPAYILFDSNKNYVYSVSGSGAYDTKKFESEVDGFILVNFVGAEVSPTDDLQVLIKRKIFVSIGDVTEKAVANLINNKTVVYNNIDNLVFGMFHGGNVLTAYGNYKRTIYIPLSVGSVVEINTKVSEPTFALYAIFDSDKRFIREARPTEANTFEKISFVSDINGFLMVNLDTTSGSELFYVNVNSNLYLSEDMAQSRLATKNELNQYQKKDKIDTVLFSDDFSTQKQEWQSTGWNYSTGKYTNTEIGISNILWLKPFYNINKRTLTFDVTPVDSELIIVCATDKNGGGEGSSGFSIDFNQKKLKVFEVSSNYSSPNINSDGTHFDKVLDFVNFGFTPVVGRKYKVVLSYYDTEHTLQIIDTISGNTASLQIDGWKAGRQQQNYGFYVTSGFISISNLVVKAISNLDILFVGDSITEGVMVMDKSKRWTKQIECNIDSIVGVSARGGHKITDVIEKFYTEILPLSPKVTYIMIGINSGASAAQYTELYNLFTANNLKVRFCFLTATNVFEDRQKVCNSAIRSVIPQSSWGFRFDLSTSVENNGYTCNPSLFYDGLHPKENGCTEMAKRIFELKM